MADRMPAVQNEERAGGKSFEFRISGLRKCKNPERL